MKTTSCILAAAVTGAITAVTVGLDVRTQNGGVNLSIPSGYSARLETGTVNGRMNVEFPVTVEGRIGRSLSTQLGSGGALIAVHTSNGGVSVRQQ